MAKIMKDGKPSTSFSRQDREWVKSMRGGDTPTGTITITENGEYDVTGYATADVQVEGGSSDFSTAEITLVLTLPEGVTADAETISQAYVQYPTNEYGIEGYYVADFAEATNHKVTIILYNGEAFFNDYAAYSGDDTYNHVVSETLSENIEALQGGGYKVTGNCTITAELNSGGIG